MIDPAQTEDERRQSITYAAIRYAKVAAWFESQRVSEDENVEVMRMDIFNRAEKALRQACKNSSCKTIKAYLSELQHLPQIAEPEDV